MANYANLLATIAANIYTNHNEEVTAAMVKAACDSIVNSLGYGYQFRGAASPGDDPGIVDQRIYFLASTPGYYAFFGGITVDANEVAVLKWDSAWSKETLDIPSKTQIMARLSAQDSRLDGQDSRLDGQDTEIADFEAAVQNQIENYPMITINGDVTNAPDEEDITTDANDLLKFKNRSAVDGLGYVILRKGGSNTFANQVTDENTIYEIRYDFDLGGASVTIPSGCVLKFNGGKVTNGTLDLNNDCDIVGSGINCEIANPSKKAIPLSCYLSDVSDSTLNRRVVQALLDAGAAVLDDIQSIEFDDYISISSAAVFVGIEKRRAITFPNSRGFVWDQKVYSARNKFENLAITAKNTAFDFVNGGDANRPMNVYFSLFNLLDVESQDGDCFSAGDDNKGSTNDSCCFDNEFISLYVQAPNGYGFKSISSNTERFVKIRSGNCGEAVFYNCGGWFESYNGTFGNNDQTLFKAGGLSGGGAVRLHCHFVNCNVESFKKTLFDCNSPLVYMHLIFEGCSFYITPNASNVVDFCPFDFHYLYQLVWHNNTVNYYGNNPSYAAGCKLFRIVYANLGNYDSNSALDVISSGSISMVIPSKRSAVMNGITQDQWGNQLYNACDRFKAGIINSDILWLNDKTIELSTTPSSLSIPSANMGGSLFIFKFTSASGLDVAGTASFERVAYTSLNGTSISRFPAWSFLFKNGNTNKNFRFYHNLGYDGRFVCSTGDDIVVAPGKYVKITMFFQYAGSSIAIFFVEPVEKNIKSGTTRPTADLYRGFQFFDANLTPPRPIWWNGSAWVDATGAAV